MKQSTWLDHVTALGTLATPILVLVLAGIGWGVRVQLERRFELEDNLREDRIAVYNEILEPFMLLLMSDAAWQSDPNNKERDKNALATQKMLSFPYRVQGFRLSLIGSDAVVRSYNELMQYFFQRGAEADPAGELEAKEIVSLLGTFLLEIRRSMGNEATELDNWDMLEWFLSDARRLRPE